MPRIILRFPPPLRPRRGSCIEEDIYIYILYVCISHTHKNTYICVHDGSESFARVDIFVVVRVCVCTISNVCVYVHIYPVHVCVILYICNGGMGASSEESLTTVLWWFRVGGGSVFVGGSCILMGKG